MYALAATDQKYPWGEYSPATKLLQQSINAHFAQTKFCPIPTDGKLDARTCGAGMQALALAAGTQSRLPEELAIATKSCRSYAEVPTAPCRDTTNMLKAAGVIAAAAGLAWVLWSRA